MSNHKPTIVCFRTKEKGYLIIIISIIKNERNPLQLVFLADPWKTGLREFDKFQGSIAEVKEKLNIPTIDLHEISKKEAYMLLAQNLTISTTLELTLNDDLLKWLNKLKIKADNNATSIYKCFNCEINDLTKKENDEIINIAKIELKNNVVGTKMEKQFFYICKLCKSDLHKSHT
ncbi:MAG: hypothetical protein OEZ01_13400 [Candidatus Heimdallarchaeota archaeon]|nr:hypothetical protein [Candidatus Heimdallarchaeota archaeon]MDH5647003.1 hypothetical protein [Candidatus Heimdallarchaeota archaeon]